MRRVQKDKVIYAILLGVAIVLFWAIEDYFWPAAERVEPGRVDEIPAYIIPEAEKRDLVFHAYYMLDYNEEHEQPDWLAYGLKSSQLTSDDRKRPFFIEDPKVRTTSADWRNYKNSGYDRGHLCPAGDRRFSESAYNETFYTSNISPMKPDFNAGVWNRLEIQVRRWAREYDSLYVITGGVLKRGLIGIGHESVSVPEAFFKIVVRGDKDHLQTISFLIPHRESSKPLGQFRVSVNQLEAETGIDFFNALEDGAEERLESQREGSAWKF